MENRYLTAKEVAIITFWKTKQIKEEKSNSFNIDLYLKIKWLRIERENK